MKKVLFVLTLIALLVAACCPNVQAQTNYATDDRIVVNASDLTPDQLAKLKAEAELELMEKKLKTYGDWVGVGGEIGEAIDQGLRAVVEVAGEFGETDVGKFTLVMIAWKVMGRDVVKILLGLVFIAMFTWLLIYSFRRTCVERRIITKRHNPGLFRYPKEKEWKIVEPLFTEEGGLAWIRIAHLLFFFIGIWITYGIMF